MHGCSIHKFLGIAGGTSFRTLSGQTFIAYGGKAPLKKLKKIQTADKGAKVEEKKKPLKIPMVSPIRSLPV